MKEKKTIRGKKQPASKKDQKERKSGPISLAPLTPEQAIADLLKVKPEPKKHAEKKQLAKKKR